MIPDSSFNWFYHLSNFFRAIHSEFKRAIMKQLIFCSAFLLITILASAQTFYTENDLPSFNDQPVGTRFTVLIPADRYDVGKNQVLTGTGTYTLISNLRSAAIHCGAIKPKQGGIVSVEIVSGIREYKGTLQNGLQSDEMKESSEDLSDMKAFTVVRDMTYDYLPEDVIFTDWIKPRHMILDEKTTRANLFFPPNGKPWGFVNGTDYYTWDSHIGTAAVHAGKITFEKGGLVTVEFYPKGKKAGPYKGSTRFGVTTSSWNIPGSLETFHFLTPPPPRTNQPVVAGNLEGAGVTNEFVFVKLNSKEYNVAGFHVNGDHVSILYDTTTGALQKICYRVAGSEDAVFITCDAEQRPYLIETKEAVYRFYNFKNNTASLVKAEPGKQPQVIENVPFDWQPPIVQQPGKEHGPSAITYRYDQPFEITAALIIKSTGYALKLATCGLAAAASAGAAILPCTSVFVSAMADFLPDNNSAKKEFQKLEKLIGAFESYAPQGFPKKRIMELLELSQSIAEKDLKVYEVCKSIKGWLDAWNSVTNYIDPAFNGRPANTTPSGNKPQTQSASVPQTFTYAHTTFVSLFTLVGDNLKEETVRAALMELGNNNYALLDAHGIFANVGRKVTYEMVKSPLDNKEGWERLMQKQKEGYKLVYVLLYAVLMRVEGYNDPVIHEIKETKRNDLVNPNIKLTEEIANGYLNEGYEFLGMGLQDKTIRLFLVKQPGSHSKYELKFTGHDGLVNGETVKSLIQQGYKSCGYVIAIYGKDPNFEGSPLPFIKEKGKAGYQCREVLLSGPESARYDRKDFMEAVNKVTTECNKQVEDGFYLDFFLTDKNKIQVFFHK